MEASVDEDIKFFDDTAAFIFSSVSSTLPTGESCEVDCGAVFVKTEATSPVRDTADVDRNPALHLESEQSLKMFIKTEATSPVRDTAYVDRNPALHLESVQSLKMFIKTEAASPQHVEQYDEEKPPGLPEESFEVSSKAWFVKTETTIPVMDTTKEDQNSGLQMECEPNLNMLIKTEVTSPCTSPDMSPQRIRQYEQEILPDSDNNKATGDMRRSRSSYSPPNAPLQSDLETHVNSLHEQLNATQSLHFPANYEVPRGNQSLRSSHCPQTAQLQSDLQAHVDSVHKQFNATQSLHCEYNTEVCIKKLIDSAKIKVKKMLVLNKDKNNCKGKGKTCIVDTVNHTMFECPHCQYKTRWNCKLKKHIDAVHNKIRPFQCPRCEYKTNSKDYLKKHIDSLHNKIWAFQCTRCKFKTNWKGKLNLHINTVHNKIRPYECSHCEHKTNCKSKLKLHIDSIHNKIKPYQCPHCEYKTNHKYYIQQHIDTVHHKIKAFQCPHCELKTNWKLSLEKHIDRVHNNIRVFQCLQCHHKTNSKPSLNRHINSVH